MKSPCLFIALAVGLASAPAMVCAAQAQQPPVKTYTVHKRFVPAGVSVGGTVIARTAVTLSAEQPGRVESIAGTEGDAFEEGAILLTLDDDDLLARRRSAVAEFNNANAALANAGVQYSREVVSPQSRRSPGGMGMPGMMDQMFTNPMSSMMGTRQPGAERHADIYASGVRIESARAALEQARSRIEEIDASLRDARSVAPFKGVITKKYIEVGDTVQPGQPLLDFADTSLLQIQTDVPVRLAPGLNEGMQVAARLDTSGELLAVTVAKIFPTADTMRHTVRVKFELPGDARAKAGMYATVVVPDRQSQDRELLLIPQSAVIWQGGLPMVFVVDTQGRASLRLVRVGDSVGLDGINILSGLSEGDDIVIRPRPGLVTGTQVR